MIKFGNYAVSRLIAGGNPTQGGSHQTRLMNMHMREYFTLNGILQFLHRCEKEGINTWQTAYSDGIRDALLKFRAEDGKMQWICLCTPDEVADKAHFSRVLELNPIGVAFHGEVTDVLWRSGKVSVIPDTLAKIRDSGAMVGLSTHNPEVIDYVEGKEWDLDFYMTCVYRKSRNNDELMEIMREVPIGEIYLPSDVPRMCETIKRAKRTCLAFKILAAGRTCDSSEQVGRAFEFVLKHIKSKDAVIVGMYPRYADQIRENADFVRKYS